MNTLLQTIFFSIWAMDPERGLALLPEVKRVLEGHPLTLTAEEIERARNANAPTLFAEGFNTGSDWNESDANAPDPEKEKYVLVMPIRGPILREDQYCGPYGMETKAKMLRRAENDTRVLGVVLDMDSPGGQGSGMEVFAKQLLRMTKPVVTYVNCGIAASAAYGIAVATKEIILSGKSDVVGSIGTYMTLADFRKHYAEYFKLPVHEVYATESTQKNRPFLEALKADPNNPADEHYTALREQIIDPFNTEFIAHVKANRKGIKDKDGVFNGAVFFGDAAIKLGMADGYGTLDTAIERVRQLARTNKQKNNGRTNAAIPNTQPETTKTMTFKELLTNAVAGFATMFKNKEDITTESLAAANAELKEKGVEGVVLVTAESVAQIELAQGLIAGANTARNEAEAKATGLQKQLDEANAKIAELKTEPVPDGQATGATSNTGDEDPAETTAAAKVADLPFNVAAREAVNNR